MTKKIVAVLTMAAAVVLGLLTTTPAHADDKPPARFEGPDRTICIESLMGSGWTSDDAAFQELNDAVWYWNIELREGAGSCDDEDHVVTLHRVNDPNKGRAWTSRVTLYKYDDDGDRFQAITGSDIYMNVNDKFDRTWRQNKLTWMHEGAGHAMARDYGPAWDSHGHTERCDSIMSTSYVCMSQFTDTGPSDWDLDWIGDVYHEWHEVTFRPMTFTTG